MLILETIDVFWAAAVVLEKVGGILLEFSFSTVFRSISLSGINEIDFSIRTEST